MKQLQEYKDDSFNKEEAYLRAQKRLKDLKGFYWHAFWYAVVNIFIVTMVLINGGDFFDFGTWSTPFFWGIGLGFHAIGVFGKHLVFSKNWEERKIKEYMDKDNFL